jgi:3-isopropylmalate/(R)-2-methylmalate dehydratase large subunit
MGMTITEKILARYSSRKEVHAGSIVECDVEAAIMNELTFSSIRKPVKVWDPDKVWLLADHQVPAPTIGAANDMINQRQFGQKVGVKNFIDIGKSGISHVVLSEMGIILPGTLIVNVDSHTASIGAMNCAGRGIGNMDMLGVLCTGKTWFLVGPTVKFVVKGKMPHGVYPRDIIHFVAAKYGDFSNQNIEWFGPVIQEMDMAGRFTIATMCVEIAVEFALFECDQTTRNFLKGRTDKPYEPAFADADANYKDTYEIDVNNLEPYVVLPDKFPHNAKPIGDIKGIKIHQAYIGSCGNARLSDLKVAADIVKGREVAPGVRFIVTPGSQQTYLEALDAGYIKTLTKAGAVVTNSTCGACFGGSMGLLGDDEICISASTRNFRGRMGSPKSRVYLGSPAVVAASALKGEITDPRDY